ERRRIAVANGRHHRRAIVVLVHELVVHALRDPRLDRDRGQEPCPAQIAPGQGERGGCQENPAAATQRTHVCPSPGSYRRIPVTTTVLRGRDNPCLPDVSVGAG